jgi:alkylmercury lyase-like protein
MSAETDVQVKVAIYREFAETGRAPGCERIAARTGLSPDRVRDSLQSLRAQRLLFLEPDGATIRMAPPFSGVPTYHVVEAGGVEYYANCAWDSLGILAALKRPGRVRSRCAQSGEPLDLVVGERGPEPSTWLFHCLVPAVGWWEDIVFT